MELSTCGLENGSELDLYQNGEIKEEISKPEIVPSQPDKNGNME